MSQLSFDVIKRVWPKSGLVTLFKKYSRNYLLKNSSKFTVVDGVIGIGVVVWMKRSVAINLYSLSLSFLLSCFSLYMF